ncbi:MAG: indolepyruvate oxidoreductase subunit beta [Gemmatimonadota bacterium]|jgi:indolepyruvate ferredoxin oxidoreductase, beta subunit
METRNVLLAGVGGHGVLALSRILAEGALAAGFDVRKSEVHGMAQRGGSVVSEVRYGENVSSTLIPLAGVDVLVSLELLEALRHLPRVRAGGLVLVNEQRITPTWTGAGPAVAYPEDAPRRIEAVRPGARVIPAHAIASGLGEPRAANMVMLGAFSARTPEIEAGTWEETIRLAFRPSLHAVNLAAFERGRAHLAGASADVPATS